MAKATRDEIVGAIAERMNRFPYVRWDRAVFHAESAAVYGWIDRDDGRSDFVLLEATWGETTDIVGAETTWFSVGFTTSSAVYSAEIHRTLFGEDVAHKECERVEDVFGALVERRVGDRGK